MVDAVFAQYKPLPFYGRVISTSTKKEYPIFQTRRFQPPTFKAALSGSGTKCSVVRGMWNAVSPTSRGLSLDTWECPTHLFLIQLRRSTCDDAREAQGPSPLGGWGRHLRPASALRHWAIRGWMSVSLQFERSSTSSVNDGITRATGMNIVGGARVCVRTRQGLRFSSQLVLVLVCSLPNVTLSASRRSAWKVSEWLTPSRR